MDRGGTATSIGMTFLCSDTKRFLRKKFVDGRTTEISRGGSLRRSLKSLIGVALLGKTLYAHGTAFNQAE